MKKNVIERESAYKLIRLMRDSISKEDLSVYLKDNSKEGRTELDVDEYYGSNVPLFRRNGYRQSGTMIP